jgi:hypothetical protein
MANSANYGTNYTLYSNGLKDNGWSMKTAATTAACPRPQFLQVNMKGKSSRQDAWQCPRASSLELSSPGS